MRGTFQKAITCGLWLLLAACSDGTNYAPVSDISAIDPIPKTGFHRVTKGETLYEIAWRYGLDYRYLAERNRIKPPYAIQVGQNIFLQGGNSTIINLVDSDLENTTPSQHQQSVPRSIKPLDKVRVKQANAIEVEPNFPALAWVWPAKGKIINSFSSSYKGINIAGLKGEAVFASAGGKVVYCGNGLRGYGNLIILKHNSLYLSAYAHNSRVYVKEGDIVQQGQKIAEMGNTGTDKVMLHFEIRHAGKPVDPVSLLDG